MILIIDNYDSFIFNIYHYALAVKPDLEIKILRNDSEELDILDFSKVTHIIISPGPCTPNESGKSINIIKNFTGKIPILGICLGHQCIAQAFGATVSRAKNIYHGKTSIITSNKTSIFSNLPAKFEVMRYHSLSVKNIDKNIMTAFAHTKDNEIMALYLNNSPTTIGLQFHPESILTKEGKQIIKNFLELSCESNI